MTIPAIPDFCVALWKPYKRLLLFPGGGGRSQGRPRGFGALLVGVRRRWAPPHCTSIGNITPYQLVMVAGGQSPDVPAVCVCVRACLLARALQGVSSHTCTHACVGVYLGVIGEWADLLGVFVPFPNTAALLWLPLL